jgi:hypothetical protein
MAYGCLVYFLWLYTLDIARDRAGALHLTHVGTWIGDAQFYFPYIVGFAIVAIGIPYVAKIAIPTFMALDWRTALWPKLWALFLAVAVSFVVVAGTFTVQGDTLLERDRASAVAVSQAEQGAAVLGARIASKEAELRSMMENRNAYLAQAASVGAAEWQRSYIDRTPPGDYQRDRIVRALGAARAADSLRAEISALREQAATQTTVAAVAARVTTERTSWIADTLAWLEGARAMLLSLVMDVVCLIMPWIALRLEQSRVKQLAVSSETRETLDERSMLEDLRNQPPIEAEPMRPPRMTVTDAETGEKVDVVRVRAREHWRKVPRGKRVKVEVDAPDIVERPAAASATDPRLPSAPLFAGVPAGLEIPLDQPEADQQLMDDDGAANDREDGDSDHGEVNDVIIAHDAPPLPPEEDADAAAALAEIESGLALPDGEGVMKRELEPA